MNEKNGIILNRRTNSLTISEFYENHLLNKYDYKPSYQRKSNVWSIEKQSFLIDSLLKNYPIPPIFLHAVLDTNKGKTVYKVIDGKQRLTSIVKFINDELFLPENFGDDDFGDESLNGLKFSEIDSNSPFKENFWTYTIPIEYVDTRDKAVVDKIFDRLNRNGEPLNPQELRNAKYSETNFLKLVKTLSESIFWKERLTDVVEISRMEDEEFISELIFTILEGTIDAKPSIIDSLYEKWYERINVDQSLELVINEKFSEVTDFMQNLNLNYEFYKIKGISHLYGLYGFSKHCVENQIDYKNIIQKTNEFFTLFKQNDDDLDIIKYKNSMSYSTKSKGQRNKRINALISYCL
ncbi:DUF262 domain-containing protein [Peribacillus sp. NPDC097206]|uniref:DUF262 domain-containing protein n=1 Tax=Peribacillus sp. NPDC097206 TaxID=3364398 RepID=UPI00381C732F